MPQTHRWAERLLQYRPTRQVHLALGLLAPMVALLWNMVRNSPFTIDDSFISFRYSRNLADGLGLVYNAGEYIEGYTNFLFTLVLALGVALGIDPVLASKLLGGAAACGTLWFVFRFAERLRPFGLLPCLATWLIATSPLYAGYGVFGLETTFFALLVTAGAWLVYTEEDRALAGARVFPWSGLVFAAAGLTRPEAPLFLGLVMLTLGRRFLSARNIARGLLFVAPVAAHLLWRHAYYGDWLPATLYAKTGDLTSQLRGGLAYLKGYLQNQGLVALLALPGVVVGLRSRPRETIAFAAITLLFTAYIISVGGDWMPYHRFFAPVEPFFYLLIGLGAAWLADVRRLPVLAALLVAGGYLGWQRQRLVNQSYRRFVFTELRGHMLTAGAASDWLIANPPGKIAIGDIGLVGYRTNYPLLDTLGLVDPVISRLPGGYTRKLGPGFADRIFSVMPEYIVIIVHGKCDDARMLGAKAIVHDKRFWPNYFVAHRIKLGGNANWCIYEHKQHRKRLGLPPIPPAD